MKTFACLLTLLTLTASAQAKLVTRPVAYEHAGVKLEGYLAYDDEKTAKGKVPGVLVAPEWWGLNDYVKGRADRLAKLGYVALALDLYGEGQVTTEPKKAQELSYGQPMTLMVERAQAGLDTLLQSGMVDENRVAIIGYCFGGSVAQALAYTGAPLAGMVSFHGGLIPVPADAATKTKAKILVCHGAIDPFVSKDALAAFLKAMDEGKFDYQFISYAGAVHAFTNPNSDRVRVEKGLNGVGYNKPADKRSWDHMRGFFNEIFAVAK